MTYTQEAEQEECVPVIHSTFLVPGTLSDRAECRGWVLEKMQINTQALQRAMGE